MVEDTDARIPASAAEDGHEGGGATPVPATPEHVLAYLLAAVVRLRGDPDFGLPGFQWTD